MGFAGIGAGIGGAYALHMDYKQQLERYRNEQREQQDEQREQQDKFLEMIKTELRSGRGFWPRR